MSFASIRSNRPSNPTRRRPGGRALSVESLETKALLTSAAVNAAIGELQQAAPAVQSQIAAEIATLKSNIVTIEQSYQSFISTSANGDKTVERDALRDEKYGIGQQNFLIHQLQQTESQFDATIKFDISGVKHGKIDPTNVYDVISTGQTNLEAIIGTVDSIATSELNGLTATFDSGNT